jgi:hypothetical protein
MARSVKVQTNVRLTELGRTLLDKLTDLYGVSQADVIEMLIRDRARNEGLFSTMQAVKGQKVS